MLKSDAEVLVPPRLFAGVVLLYWGVMIDQPLIGLVFAFLLETRNWVDYRWEIGEREYVKAFYVTLFLIGIALLIIRLDTVDMSSFAKMIRWSPAFFLPIELAQRYGKSDRMYLNTFFYFSRMRMLQDRREGRAVRARMINTGYPYIFGVLISASCNDRNDWVATIGMFLIVMLSISFISRQRHLSLRGMWYALPLLVVSFLVGQQSMQKLYQHILKIRTGEGASMQQDSHDAYSSMLGALGQVKQSKEIKWRVWADYSPEYLYTGVYNEFATLRWKYAFNKDRDDGGELFDSLSASFDARVGIKDLESEDREFVFYEEEFNQLDKVRTDSSAKEVKVRGLGKTKTTESIVPAVRGFKLVSKVAGEETVPTVNPMGVIKMVDRKAMIDFTMVDTKHLSSPGSVASLRDLIVPLKHQSSVDKLVDEIGLNSDQSAREKIGVIRSFFMNKFTYATHFKSNNFVGRSDLERFMHDERKGHCEYFATTAALMLRRLGVPTRYVVGFVVREKDGDEWIVRGTHGHAWCHAWIDGKWENVDLTPPDWFMAEDVDSGVGVMQSFGDWFQRMREDFQVWKSQPGNDEIFQIILICTGGIVLVWFAWRGWNKRLLKDGRHNDESEIEYQLPKAMEIFVSSIEKKVGVKPTGLSLRSWLLSHEVNELGVMTPMSMQNVIELHEKARFNGDEKAQKELVHYLNKNP